MPNTHNTLDELFNDIADAIRAKTGNSGTIVADNFPTAISNIPAGGANITITYNDTAVSTNYIKIPSNAIINTSTKTIICQSNSMLVFKCTSVTQGDTVDYNLTNVTAEVIESSTVNYIQTKIIIFRTGATDGSINFYSQ